MHVIPCLAAFFLLGLPAISEDDLRTAAEKTDYRATAKYADVVELCKKIAAASKGVVRLSDMGTTNEGRSLPLMIVSDPPVGSPEEAARSGKLVVFLIGNIHAGEVDGKEALPMLVREIAATPGHPLLKNLILLVAPIYNADGNERFAKTNRPGQVGPEEGMGVRHNAQNLDLNRDFVKLEAPETRGLLQILNTWNPHLFIDTHTTNGSHHRYEITYQGPKNPAGDPLVLAFVRDKLMPGAGAAMETKSGYKSFFYGNFDRDHTLWTTYGATPRFGTTYVGLRNRMSVLSEAYSYADFKTRVLATLEFTRAILEYTSDHQAEVSSLMGQARLDLAGPADVPIRSEARVSKDPVTVLGFVEEVKNSRSVATKEPKTYTVGFEQDFVPTLTVKTPRAYVLPASEKAAIANLKLHGFALKELPADESMEVEVYRVDEITRAPRAFEGHKTVELKASPRTETRRIEAGSVIVPVTGPLAALAVYLLEPMSDDGLATWNFFDASLEVGKDFPVLRVR